jgi:hypothetical protein
LTNISSAADTITPGANDNPAPHDDNADHHHHHHHHLEADQGWQRSSLQFCAQISADETSQLDIQKATTNQDFQEELCAIEGWHRVLAPEERKAALRGCIELDLKMREGRAVTSDHVTNTTITAPTDVLDPPARSSRTI